jgi:hypothetical protein
MYVLLIVLFVTAIHGQNQCECSCCSGQSCQPSIVGSVTVPNCTAEICLANCRCTYPQCAANPPYGQLLSRCINPIDRYTCRCSCCRTNSGPCMATLLGFATGYHCDTSACSIACYNQYSNQCMFDPYTQMQGTCDGPVTTTTPMTTVAPWLGNICSCLYCQSGYTCTSNVLVGITSAPQCSASDCTTACHNRYPTTNLCSTSYLNQINGVCLAEGNARTRCKCNCCGLYGCVDYEVNTNDTCPSCYGRCTQVVPCVNSRPITYTCTADQSRITVSFFLLVTSLMLTILSNLLLELWKSKHAIVFLRIWCINISIRLQLDMKGESDSNRYPSISIGN